MGIIQIRFSLAAKNSWITEESHFLCRTSVKTYWNRNIVLPNCAIRTLWKKNKNVIINVIIDKEKRKQTDSM